MISSQSPYWSSKMSMYVCSLCYLLFLSNHKSRILYDYIDVILWLCCSMINIYNSMYVIIIYYITWVAGWTQYTIKLTMHRVPVCIILRCISANRNRKVRLSLWSVKTKGKGTLFLLPTFPPFISHTSTHNNILNHLSLPGIRLSFISYCLI